MTELAMIKSRVKKLSTKDRADLAYFLLHSLEGEDDPAEVAKAWEKELERRWRRIESGKEKGVPAEEAMAKLREKYQ
jgi:putative addiction module component (TIGR02574 family)